jgi:ubiquinone/menaquinone biosynthesis C-methylase UbiE
MSVALGNKVKVVCLIVDSSMDFEAYYRRVGGAYDKIAAKYDETVGNRAVSRRAKQLALEIVTQSTPPGGRLIDIGCYTGIEALLLVERGFRVLGIDMSTEMIRIAQQKAARRRVQDRVEFRVMRASDIGHLAADGRPPFDSAYSVYGTLNLEPDLQRFKEGLSRLLRPGGKFVCGLLNPTVLYELIAGPAVGKFHGFRKLTRKPVVTGIGLGAETVEAFLYSPQEFERLMAPELSLDRTVGLHILYPPPRGQGGRGLWWVARAVDRVERRIESRFPFHSLGFFSLLVFHKVLA